MDNSTVLEQHLRRIHQGARETLQRLNSMPSVFLVFLAIGLGIYANALDNPFIYDDLIAIVENPDIRQIWPPVWMAPSIEAHAAVNARPVVALSLALNYAFDNLLPRFYHVFNLAIHVLNTVLLCGLVRQTVLMVRPAWPAATLGLACASLWLVHPLVSQCINYAIQRTELLMAFFYLGTLSAVVLGIRNKGWHAGAVLCCALGMASKEVMVSAPLIILCYDRTFAAGSFSGALSERRWLYAGLAATWGVLAWLQIRMPHGGSVGSAWSTEAWNYALNQPEMILRYLQLSLWPHPLLLDYGFPQDMTLGDIWWQALAVLILLALVTYAFFRWPAWGFLGLWFFAVLAPTTSIVPLLNEVGAERRVYLGLAALIPLVVVGGYALLRRRGAAWITHCGWAVAAICAVFSYMTIERNRDYRSDLEIWKSVVLVHPDNPRGHNNLGRAHYAAGAFDSAYVHFRQAVELKSFYPMAWGNLGLVRYHQGDRDGALQAYVQALAQDETLAHIWYNLGVAHQERGELQRAIQAYNKAVKYRPRDVESWFNMSAAHRQNGAWPEVLRTSTEVNRLAPELVDGWLATGRALVKLGHIERAKQAFTQALKLRPDDPIAQAALDRLR